MKRFSEISLRTILSIAKQPECFYFPVCSNYIDCKEIVPWCRLEKILESNNIPDGLVEDLEKFRLTSVFKKLDSRLKREEVAVIFNPVSNFVCPYFRNKIDECDFSICPYYSKAVNKTKCILSIDKEVNASNIAVAKGIKKEDLLKIIFNLGVGDSFEPIYNIMDKLLEVHKFCTVCGHFEKTCRKNKKACRKRYLALQRFKKNEMFEKLSSYPLLLVITSILKINRSFINLFPKEIITNYLK